MNDEFREMNLRLAKGARMFVWEAMKNLEGIEGEYTNLRQWKAELEWVCNSITYYLEEGHKEDE